MFRLIILHGLIFAGIALVAVTASLANVLGTRSKRSRRHNTRPTLVALPKNDAQFTVDLRAGSWSWERFVPFFYKKSRRGD